MKLTVYQKVLKRRWKMGLDGMDRMAREEFRGARPRVYGTEPDDPVHGRVFVWTKMGWFERVEGPWGDVAFSPVADSEEELRNWISRDNPDADLVEMNDEYGKMVYAEFLEQAEYALYPEAPETSSEEPFDEQDVT
jgi:hypothetical protein